MATRWHAHVKAVREAADPPISYKEAVQRAKASYVRAEQKAPDEAKQLAQELHRRVVKKFPTRRVHVPSLDHTWGADLVEMGKDAAENDGFRYILTVIDVWSRYAWARPVKQKTAAAVWGAFNDIIQTSGRRPEKLWVDQGKEFVNKKFTDGGYSKAANTLYHTFSKQKSVMVERFNRTLKEPMMRYFTEHFTRRWVDVLPQLLDDYNNRKHTTIGVSPAEAILQKNKAKVNKANDPGAARAPNVFNIGDTVRVSIDKGVFEPGYTERWSDELYTVSFVDNRDPPLYTLADYTGEEIEGRFYQAEMQKTKLENYFRVEKVLKTRTRNGKKESLVKWFGYPTEASTWEVL